MLDILHDTHPGCSRMKSTSRGYTWWPQLDSDIELLVKQCVQCQENRKLPASAPMYPWNWPQRPWSRVHIDHAGPFMNHYFLVIIDAYLKWTELFQVSSTSVAIEVYTCIGA